MGGISKNDAGEVDYGKAIWASP